MISGDISTQDFNNSIILSLYATEKVRHAKVDISASSYAWSDSSSGETVTFEYSYMYIIHSLFQVLQTLSIAQFENLFLRNPYFKTITALEHL